MSFGSFSGVERIIQDDVTLQLTVKSKNTTKCILFWEKVFHNRAKQAVFLESAKLDFILQIWCRCHLCTYAFSLSVNESYSFTLCYFSQKFTCHVCRWLCPRWVKRVLVALRERNVFPRPVPRPRHSYSRLSYELVSVRSSPLSFPSDREKRNKLASHPLLNDKHFVQ